MDRQKPGAPNIDGLRDLEQVWNRLSSIYASNVGEEAAVVVALKPMVEMEIKVAGRRWKRAALRRRQ
jgi:hypothetical protein